MSATSKSTGWDHPCDNESGHYRKSAIAFAGFWRRFFAFWFDYIPITLMVALLFYFFLGFDAKLHRYLEGGPRDQAAREEFLAARNDVRDVSMLIYLGYCSVMEATALRGTLGKWALGMVVVHSDGKPLTFFQAVRRNAGKPLSFLVCGLGCLWIAWSATKQSWHDMLAGTFVLHRYES
jgi:uncharacterized RDD family membrane protein YckC